MFLIFLHYSRGGKKGSQDISIFFQPSSFLFASSSAYAATAATAATAAYTATAATAATATATATAATATATATATAAAAAATVVVLRYDTVILIHGFRTHSVYSPLNRTELNSTDVVLQLLAEHK